MSQHFSTEPYMYGVIGSGKWNVICTDDNNSWYSFAESTAYSKNPTVKLLHRSVSKIIKNLPIIKRKKLHYKYILPSNKVLRSRSRHVLRSMIVNEPFNLSMGSADSNQSINCSQKPGDLFFDFDKFKCNKNVSAQNQRIIESTCVLKDKNESVQYSRTRTLQPTNLNTTKISSKSIKNGFDPLKIRQDCLTYDVRVNVERYDQENRQF